MEAYVTIRDHHLFPDGETQPSALHWEGYSPRSSKYCLPNTLAGNLVSSRGYSSWAYPRNRPSTFSERWGGLSMPSSWLTVTPREEWTNSYSKWQCTERCWKRTRLGDRETCRRKNLSPSISWWHRSSPTVERLSSSSILSPKKNAGFFRWLPLGVCNSPFVTRDQKICWERSANTLSLTLYGSEMIGKYAGHTCNKLSSASPWWTMYDSLVKIWRSIAWRKKTRNVRQDFSIMWHI